MFGSDPADVAIAAGVEQVVSVLDHLVALNSYAVGCIDRFPKLNGVDVAGAELPTRPLARMDSSASSVTSIPTGS